MAAPEAFAVGCCSLCRKSCGGCEVEYVEKTICCPTWVTETRTVKCCEYRQEMREREVTVCQRIPETKMVKKTVCQMVPETRYRTCCYTVSKPILKEVEVQVCVSVPVWREVQRTCCVMVPHQEKRTGTRTVCKCVPVVEKKTCTVDEGHWEEKMVEVPCCCRICCRRSSNPCAKACESPTKTVCKRVWVPNLVEKEIECTRYERVVEQVPCEYTVTVCRPEQRTITEKVCEYKTEKQTRVITKVCGYECEKKTRQMAYTVCVPTTKEIEVPVTTYRCEEVTKKVQYPVCVPVEVEREVQVCVCKMVPKTVKVPVCKKCCGCCR
jgi:hypothetical protein